MVETFANGRITVHHGDSRDVLKSIPDASVGSCVTDPPYALVSIGKRFGAENAAPAQSGKTGAYARASAGFMGQRWDTGETAFDPTFWAEVLRVLKPGAHVVAFGGTRTYHRLACAIEDAGFEVRDQIAWLYGSGFPKSHDVSKGIDRALGVDRAVVGQRRTCKGDSGAQSYAALGEFQQSRFVDVTAPATDAARAWEGWGTALKPALEPIVLARKPLEGTVAANVLKHGTGALNIDQCRVETGSEDRSARYGGKPAGRGGTLVHQGDISEAWKAPDGRWPANVIHDGSEEVRDAFPTAPGQQRPVTGEERSHRTLNAYGDFGSSRDGCEPRADAGSAARFFYSAKADAEDRLGSKHPTVKPVDLMAYLCRLVTPPGGLVLDPFAGSGSTGVAALGEGFQAVLIEREEQYVADIKRRLAWAVGDGRLTAQEMRQAPQDDVSKLPLFGPSLAEGEADAA